MDEKLRGTMIATGRPSTSGWDPKATEKRRQKNRVAARSRRKNRAAR